MRLICAFGNPSSVFPPFLCPLPPPPVPPAIQKRISISASIAGMTEAPEIVVAWETLKAEAKYVHGEVCGRVSIRRVSDLLVSLCRTSELPSSCGHDQPIIHNTSYRSCNPLSNGTHHNPWPEQAAHPGTRHYSAWVANSFGDPAPSCLPRKGSLGRSGSASPGELKMS